MRRAIVLILQDLKQGENIEGYILISAALVVAIIALSGYAQPSVIASVTLSVLSIIIYSQIKTDRLLRSLKQTHNIAGLREFYLDRSLLPSLESRLRESREEVAIMGLQIGAVTHS